MKWIKVKERLPTEDTAVIMWYENRPYSFLFGVYNAQYKEFMRDNYTHEVQFPVSPTYWAKLLPPHGIEGPPPKE